MPEERLQKIIAAAGIASRRKAEELITQGRVTVNGQTVTLLGSKADRERDHIKVDGKLLQGARRNIYLALNKPKGYVTTVSDPEGRPTVMDLVRQVSERVYPIGRLDYGSEGLLLLTNDGELANYLTRAASHVPKTYLVKIAGRAEEADIEKLRRGIRIGSKPGPQFMKAVHTAPARVRLIKEADNPWYEVTLTEGRNRQIRRMFEEIGHHVEKIRRIAYGPLRLDLEPGEMRELTPAEVKSLSTPAKTSPGKGGGFSDSKRAFRKHLGPRSGKPEWKRRGPRSDRAGNDGATAESGRKTARRFDDRRPGQSTGTQKRYQRRDEFRSDNRRFGKNEGTQTDGQRGDEPRSGDRRPRQNRRTERPYQRDDQQRSRTGGFPKRYKEGPPGPRKREPRRNFRRRP